MKLRCWLLVVIGVLSGCGARPVPLAEARVKTAAEARQLVLAALLADSVRAANLRLDAAEVEERPAEWHVYVPCRTRNVKPCGTARAVDKRTAAVRELVLL